MIERDICEQSPTPPMVPHRKPALVATSVWARRCAVAIAGVAAPIGLGAQGLPDAIAPLVSACINDQDVPDSWTAIEGTDDVLNTLAWVDALTYIVGYDMAEMIVEDRSWLQDSIDDSFQESSFWVGVDSGNDRYRYYSGPDGWTTAMILGKDHSDYLEGYANCYLWKDVASADDIAWISQWDFFDPLVALPGADEPRLWDVRRADVASETSFSESRIEAFGTVLAPDVIPDAPRTAIVITRHRYQFEEEQ